MKSINDRDYSSNLILFILSLVVWLAGMTGLKIWLKLSDHAVDTLSFPLQDLPQPVDIFPKGLLRQSEDRHKCESYLNEQK